MESIYKDAGVGTCMFRNFPLAVAYLHCGNQQTLKIAARSPPREPGVNPPGRPPSRTPHPHAGVRYTAAARHRGIPFSNNASIVQSLASSLRQLRGLLGNQEV